MNPSRPRSRSRQVVSALIGVAALVGLLAWEVGRTLPVRRALDVYQRLIVAGNLGDLAGVEALCSAHYRAAHPPSLAPEGGVNGLPRGLPHRNFRAWKRGKEVLVCPSGRDHPGPVYRFVQEDGGTWRFDGPVGLLYPDGRMVEEEVEALP